jgi:hypothetical protein
VKEEWVNQQLDKRRSAPTERDREAITQDLFRKLMFSDFYHVATGCLPSNLDQLHDAYLKGPFIVQIDEMFNIAGTTDKRYADGTGRMLKIIATDGCQNVSYFYHCLCPQINNIQDSVLICNYFACVCVCCR